VRAGLQRLRRDANDAGRVRPIGQAYARYDHALLLELAAIQRGQIPVALTLDEQSTDPAAGALNELVEASRLRFHEDSADAAQFAGIVGWMKMLVAAVATALLLRHAARSRARAVDDVEEAAPLLRETGVRSDELKEHSL
jgi:hypothetical protein